MSKKQKKNKNININQTSFYFEDYLENNKNNKNSKKNENLNISQDRIYLLFFLFISLVVIFSIKITIISLKTPEFSNHKNDYNQFTSLRRDIVDRNGTLISRNVKSYHAVVKPNLIKDKKNFLIKIRLNFPNLSIMQIEKKFDKGKRFYLKKALDQSDKEKLWALGEKGIVFESFQSRIYVHANLFSHILGQIDYDNYGISGVEKYFDRELRNKNLVDVPLQLTVDTNIQHLIDEELNKALITFNATGGGALLMNVDNGEVLSLVSLPNFNINKRADITEKKYINRITKGVYELGSIFKTFTIALALEEKLVSPNTIIRNIPKKVKCSIHEISDIKQFPENLSVEDILIRSSNVGTSILAKKIGIDKYKDFFNNSNLLSVSKFELEEVGVPKPLKWQEKCKLETISYGHGIAVTPLQVTATFSSLTNGGNLIEPTILKKKEYPKMTRLISLQTSNQINKILRKVVSSDYGTASLANEYGYSVGGKTGTSENYENKKNNLNSFISIFPSNKPKYALLVMLENPKAAPNLIYNYRGKPTKINRAEAGWNSVYVAGKIIKKIGPILAIKNDELEYNHVAKKSN